MDDEEGKVKSLRKKKKKKKKGRELEKLVISCSFFAIRSGRSVHLSWLS